VNGTTLRGFRRLLRDHPWRVVLHPKRPIGSVGRNISKSRAARLASRLFEPLTFVPGLEEVFVHRITYVLEKGD